MSMSDDICKALKDAESMTTAELANALSWDADDKKRASTVIWKLRKDGFLVTAMDNGSPRHKLVQGDIKPRALTAPKAKPKSAAVALPAAPAPQSSRATPGGAQPVDVAETRTLADVCSSLAAQSDHALGFAITEGWSHDRLAKLHRATRLLREVNQA